MFLIHRDIMRRRTFDTVIEALQKKCEEESYEQKK